MASSTLRLQPGSCFGIGIYFATGLTVATGREAGPILRLVQAGIPSHTCFQRSLGEIFGCFTQEETGQLAWYVDKARNGTADWQVSWAVAPWGDNTPINVSPAIGWEAIPIEGYCWPLSATAGELISFFRFSNPRTALHGYLFAALSSSRTEVMEHRSTTPSPSNALDAINPPPTRRGKTAVAGIPTFTCRFPATGRRGFMLLAALLPQVIRSIYRL